MKRILFISVVMFSSVAFAQAVVPPTYLDSIIAWLSANIAIIGGGVTGLEMVLRFFPSVQPLSLLVPVKYIFDGAANILSFVSVNVLAPMISNFNASSVPPAALK